MNETELMLTSILGCRRVDLYADWKPLDEFQRLHLDRMKSERQNGRPLQYVMGWTEFMGLKLCVDERVLIPRFETELLVESVLKTAEKISRQPLEILDIGSGSGNIAIALAVFLEKCQVTSVDISEEALDLARENAKISQVSHEINFIRSDIFNAFKTPNETNKFDIIVSNPPYISSQRIPHLPIEVQFEPVLALDGGVRGLFFYEQIFAQAQLFLKPDGYLFLEIGDDQRKDLEDLLKKYSCFDIIEFKKDLNERDRILILCQTRF